jgi:hypothetical protein
LGAYSVEKPNFGPVLKNLKRLGRFLFEGRGRGCVVPDFFVGSTSRRQRGALRAFFDCNAFRQEFYRPRKMSF